MSKKMRSTSGPFLLHLAPQARLIIRIRRKTKVSLAAKSMLTVTVGVVCCRVSLGACCGCNTDNILIAVQLKKPQLEC